MIAKIPSILISMFALLFAISACGTTDIGRLMEEYLWENRVVLVFSPDADNTAYRTQTEAFVSGAGGFKQRDIVTIDIVANQHVELQGEQQAHRGTPPFYRYFDVSESQFTVILLGKDGEEKLRQNAPISNEALFALIDAMPMRQREMQ